jgi:pyridoxine kinase
MEKIICAISSQVMYGQVGLNAITPALRCLGLESYACPTILLATHPGAYPDQDPPAQLDIPADRLREMLAWLNDAAGVPPVIVSGYMPSLAHVEAVADFVRHCKAEQSNSIYLCDPVCGDRGRLYVNEAVAQAIGQTLLPIADMATPNLFELQWLSNTAAVTDAEIIAAAKGLACREVIVTSTPAPAGRIATLAVTPDQTLRCETACEPRHIHGMGDTFSGLYLGLRLLDQPAALGVATATMAQLAVQASVNGQLSTQPICLAPAAPEEIL